jgi:hypothetical protein
VGQINTLDAILLDRAIATTLKRQLYDQLRALIAERATANASALLDPA